MSNVVSSYAKTLFQLAIEQNALERVYRDILHFKQVCATHTAVLHTLKNRTITPAKKLAVLQTLFQNEMHNLTLRFFALVTKKHREALLPAMAQALLVQYDQYKEIKKAQVTTTLPLSDKLTRQLQQIAQQIAPCKQVVIDQHIDPTLIGGYVLQIEDIRLDQSLRKKLLTVKKKYMTAGY